MWRTPYCGQKWLIEGLEVIAPKRGQGIGKLLVKKGIELLSNQGIKRISANINKNNIASIALHQSLGFQKSSSGAVNSYGEYREHLDEYILKL